MAKFVNIYEIHRCYGGPEEGGWWFDAGECVRSIPVPLAHVERVAERCRKLAKRESDTTHSRYSVIGGPDYEVWVQNQPGKNFPEEWPHYE